VAGDVIRPAVKPVARGDDELVGQGLEPISPVEEVVGLDVDEDDDAVAGLLEGPG